MILSLSLLLLGGLLFLPNFISSLPINHYKIDNYFPFIQLSYVNPFIYDHITDFVVFGDSYSLVGTNFTDMTYSGKNRSHGKNWPLQLLDLHPMQMWNFAEPGTTVDMSIINRESHDFIAQCHNFSTLVKDKKTIEEWKQSGLFAIWVGSNDIRSMNRSTKNKEEIYDRIMEEMFNLIDGLYQEGARNLLIINVPPLEKIPFNDDGRLNEVSVDVDYMNSLFSENIQTFAETHSDANVFLYDIYRRFNKIIENCSQYQFKDCRSDWRNHRTDSVELYFWGDFSHPTYKANEIFSNEINDFLTIISN